jgi:hypothetical protein
LPTGAASPSGTTSPTTTTINYCAEENGMNQPLTIRSDQVTSNPPSTPTTPSADINPTTSTSTPGLNFTSPSPQINITLDQPAAITVIYLPTDRPNQPANVNQFTVVFVYPNGTTSQEFTSSSPSTSGTTTTTATPSTGAPSETTTTPSPIGVVLPSDSSPQVDLPPNFYLPAGTIVIINITSTQDQLPATGVCIVCIFLVSCRNSCYVGCCRLDCLAGTVRNPTTKHFLRALLQLFEDRKLSGKFDIE